MFVIVNRTVTCFQITLNFSWISLIETENSVIAQLRVLNRRLRKAENNSSSPMQASRSKFFQTKKKKDTTINNKHWSQSRTKWLQVKKNVRADKDNQSTWNVTDDVEDSPCLDEPKPEPLHKRRSIFVTGIQDLLSNADNNALGKHCVAASFISKAARDSLYCTNTDIDWRRRSLSSALDILGSLKCVTIKLTYT